MRGCLIKRGKSGVWYAKIRATGKQKLIKLGRLSKHEAERALRLKIDEIERNFGRDLKKSNFKELAELWLNNHRIDKKAKTITSYSFVLSTYLIPFLGDIQVQKIMPEDVERFKQITIGKVSATTTNYALRILCSILDFGIRLGYIYANAAKLVNRIKQEKKQFKAFSREEVNTLIENTAGQNKVLLTAAVITGLRMGEILAMKWENINWQERAYAVKESWNGSAVDTPKTESSVRTVLMSSALIELLREHKRAQLEYKMLHRDKYKDNGLVFAAETGGYINPSNLRNRIFYPALKKAGLPKNIRFHDLRGTCATLLLASGADLKSVQDQLGHKTAKMTLEVYAKVNPEAKKKAIEKLETYLAQGLR